MPLQAVEVTRLYRQIADQLVQLIDDGEYRPGERLPAERALAERLGVSRPTVREALIALEVEGRVDIRGGSGVFVLPHGMRKPAMTSGASQFGPFDVLAARAAIEPEVAAVAAARITLPLLGHLADTVADMRSAEAGSSVAMEQDRKFHLMLAEASGNAAFAAIIKMLWDQRRSPIYLQLEGHFGRKAAWARAVDEHQAVLTALRARDSRRARVLMRQHIRKAEKRYLARWQTGARAERASLSYGPQA